MKAHPLTTPRYKAQINTDVSDLADAKIISAVECMWKHLHLPRTQPLQVDIVSGFETGAAMRLMSLRKDKQHIYDIFPLGEAFDGENYASYMMSVDKEWGFKAFKHMTLPQLLICQSLPTPTIQRPLSREPLPFTQWCKWARRYYEEFNIEVTFFIMAPKHVWVCEVPWDVPTPPSSDIDLDDTEPVKAQAKALVIPKKAQQMSTYAQLRQSLYGCPYYAPTSLKSSRGISPPLPKRSFW